MLLSEGEEGKGTEILGKKIKILKWGGGEEYHVIGNFIHSWLIPQPTPVMKVNNNNKVPIEGGGLPPVLSDVEHPGQPYL